MVPEPVRQSACNGTGVTVFVGVIVEVSVGVAVGVIVEVPLAQGYGSVLWVEVYL
jgi:hypothetical protein